MYPHKTLCAPVKILYTLFWGGAPHLVLDSWSAANRKGLHGKEALWLLLKKVWDLGFKV